MANESIYLLSHALLVKAERKKQRYDTFKTKRFVKRIELH